MTERKEFGCEQCGHKITAISPDDIHTLLCINKNDDSCIKIPYECDNCYKRNIRYWCIVLICQRYTDKLIV